MVDLVGSFVSRNSGYKSIESYYEEIRAAQRYLAAGGEELLRDSVAVVWRWTALTFGEGFEEVLRYATRLHRAQMRKGINIPYVTHLLAVAAKVGENDVMGDERIGTGAKCGCRWSDWRPAETAGSQREADLGRGVYWHGPSLEPYEPIRVTVYRA
jgi:hypothetical protein